MVAACRTPEAMRAPGGPANLSPIAMPWRRVRDRTDVQPRAPFAGPVRSNENDGAHADDDPMVNDEHPSIDTGRPFRVRRRQGWGDGN